MEIAQDVSYSLAHDLNKSLREKKTLEIENDDLRAKAQAKICRLTDYKRVSSEKRQLERKVEHLNDVISLKNISLKQVRASKTYLFKKNEQLKASVENLENEIDVLKLSINEKKKENQELLEENEYLRGLVNENHVILYNNDCNAYTAETQECVYTLLNHNVTTSNVSLVIEAVLKRKFEGKQVTNNSHYK